ncbi:MAG: LacI family transcriptional regulator [Calditrichaeota bacterium]|nr:MAG: LacI family transcriptional regulator [Calditrichota bacterium]
MARPKATTLKDIAERLGLSVPTVSRALAGHTDIAKETRELVLRTAQEMNYRPNVHAKNLVTGQVSMENVLVLGVPNVLRSIAFNSYYAEIMWAFCDTIDTTRYRLVLAVDEAADENFVDYHQLIRNHSASAAIILDLKINDERVRELTEANIPLVVLGEYDPQNDRQCAVWTDNVKGAYLATRHLIVRGRRKIALVGGLQGQKVSQSRLKGYRQALEEANISFDENLVVEPLEVDEHGGYAAMYELIHRKVEFDAVFCASDLRSIGVIKALREQGLSVPSDISVVGYDDLPIASYFDPPLTTIRQPTYKVGAYAMRSLEKLMRGEPVPQRKKVFLPELVIRASA